MKHQIYSFTASTFTQFLVLMLVVTMISSCGNDDDTPMVDPPPAPKEMVDFKLHFDDLGVEDAESFCVVTDLEDNVLFEEYYDSKNESVTIKRPKDEDINVTRGSGNEGEIIEGCLYTYVVAASTSEFKVEENYNYYNPYAQVPQRRPHVCADGYGDVFWNGAYLRFNVTNVDAGLVLQTGLINQSGSTVPQNIRFNANRPYMSLDESQSEFFLVIEDVATGEIKGKLLSDADLTAQEVHLDFNDFQPVIKRYVDISYGSEANASYLLAIGSSLGRKIYLSQAKTGRSESESAFSNKLLMYLPQNVIFDDFKIDAGITNQQPPYNDIHTSQELQEFPQVLNFESNNLQAQSAVEHQLTFSFDAIHDVVQFDILIANSLVWWSVIHTNVEEVDFSFANLPPSLTVKYPILDTEIDLNETTCEAVRMYSLFEGEQLPTMYSTSVLRELVCIPHYINDTSF